MSTIPQNKDFVAMNAKYSVCDKGFCLNIFGIKEQLSVRFVSLAQWDFAITS
jgi:hypothetical protein